MIDIVYSVKKEFTDFGYQLNYMSSDSSFELYKYDDEPSVLYLAWVYVSPAKRKRGIGNLLLSYAESEAKKMNADYLCLQCLKSSWVYNWYKRHGFVYFYYDRFNLDYVWLRKCIKMKDFNKPILDVCCGGKMFYFDKQDNRVLFQDIRDFETTLCDGRHFEVKPDVQADFTNMPYPDETFRMVVFDPPHLLRNVSNSKKADIYGCSNQNASPSGYQHIKYGALPNSDWKDMLRKGFSECFRVLAHGGFLIFKWNETDIKVSEVLKLTDEKPVFGHISGKRANTHWICFLKS